MSDEALDKLRAAHELLQRARAATLTGKEMGDFDESPAGLARLRAEAKILLGAIREEEQGMPCPALGGPVAVRGRGIRKVMSMSADMRKLQILPALKAIFATGEKIGSKPPYNQAERDSVLAYHTLRAVVQLDGKDLAVRVVVKEDHQGKYHYDHTVHALDAVLDSAKENAPGHGALLAANSDGGWHDHTRLASGQLGTSVYHGGGVINLFFEGEAHPVLDDVNPALARLRRAAAALASARAGAALE